MVIMISGVMLAILSVILKRAPELTEDQEKKLHQLGRKVRKKFGMKPVRIEE